jgi:hypothetical protein
MTKFFAEIIHKQKKLSILAFDPKNGKEIGIVSSNFQLFDPVIGSTQGLFY